MPDLFGLVPEGPERWPPISVVYSDLACMLHPHVASGHTWRGQ